MSEKNDELLMERALKEFDETPDETCKKQLRGGLNDQFEQLLAQMKEMNRTLKEILCKLSEPKNIQN